LELNGIFQDWAANAGNPKARLILSLFRVASFFSRIPLPFRWLTYPYILLYRVTVEWILCIELPWRLIVGPGLRLYHGQALVVNDRVVIGKNCILRHSSTIGACRTDLNYSGVVPVIGDDVDIGSNVVVVGNVKIGDGAMIGAGSVVVRDVPPRAVVVGNPAKVIRLLDRECD